MLAKRIVVCLDVNRGRVAKGVRFERLRDVGDPAEMAARYEAEGADEIVLLDINASHEARATTLDVVRRTAERVFVPLTVGGGIRTANDVAAALRAGADKVSVNSAAVVRPEVLDEASYRFGAQCVVASIDVRREWGEWWVCVNGGRTPTELPAVEWAVECAARGAGEILLTSIDRDGSRAGYDLELTRAVAAAVAVPVVASGGAGSAMDVRDVFRRTGADAALLAGILHDGRTTVADIKRTIATAGFAVRSTHE
jgi:imidazole glycerol-phosphate synthase subunit HisF